MKKKILLLMVALMAVTGMSAQSIVGTWADEPEKDESGQTEQIILNIGKKTFEMVILVDDSDEQTGTVIVSVSLPGTSPVRTTSSLWRSTPSMPTPK